MSSPTFELCNNINCTKYDATGVFYVSLSTFRNIFKFKTTEIENDNLPTSTLESSQNITYYVDSSIFQITNPAYAMMNSPYSEGIIYISTTDSTNLIINDFIYYIGKKLLNHYSSVALFSNIKGMKDIIELNGFKHKTAVELLFKTANNSNMGKKNIVYSNNNDEISVPPFSTIQLTSVYEFTDPDYADPFLIVGENGEYLFTDSGGTDSDYKSDEVRAITFDAGDGNTFQIKIINLKFEIGSYYYYDRLGLTASNNMGDLNEKSSNLSLKTAPILSKFMYETDSDNPKIVWGRSFDATHSGDGGWVFPPTHNNSNVVTDTWLDINTRYIRFYFRSDSSVEKFGWQIKMRNKNTLSGVPEVEKTNIYIKQNIDASVTPFFLFYIDNKYTEKIKRLEKNKKYRFYYNNPGNIIDSGHPFWFGSTNSHNSDLHPLIKLTPSNTNRNKTSGILAGEYLDIEIDINYNDELYYYCTTHSTMIKQFGIVYPIDNTNLTKLILEQIKESHPDRLTVKSQNNSNGGYDIQNATSQNAAIFDKSIHRYDYYDYENPIVLTGECSFYDSGGVGNDYTNSSKFAITFDAGANNIIFIKIINLSFEASNNYPYHYDRLGITSANNIDDLETDNLNAEIAPDLSAFLYHSQNNDPTAGYNQRYVLDSNKNPITNGYIFPSSHITDSVGNSNVITNTWLKINTRYVRFYFYSDGSISKPGWDIKLAAGTPSTFKDDGFDYNSRIQDTTSQQSVPLVEGDSINYYWTLKCSNVPDRKYRIKLHLTDNEPDS
jgi:hypothetical protein